MAKDYDNDDLDRDMVRDVDRDVDRNFDRDRPGDEPQVAALSDLGDYEVAEGYPDPRGWTVRSSDGTEVGKVHDLIVDTGSMRTRYLDVRLAKDVAGATEDRDVLVPIGTARVEDDGDNVIVNGLTADRIVMLPAYDHRQLTREQETDLRTRFTSGDAMSAGVIGAGATGGSDFYDHHHFDDRNFFGRRRGRGTTDREMPRETARDVDTRADRAANEEERLTVSEEQLAIGKKRVEAGEVGVRKNVETRHVEQEVPLTREEVTVERRPISADAARNTSGTQITEDEIRVPVMREEAVVEKRLVPTEEIIIRKTARRDTETVGADLRRERVEVDKDSTGRVRENVVDRTNDERRA
jgi:uncharacterized protein (TIGR02271 family)